MINVQKEMEDRDRRIAELETAVSKLTAPPPPPFIPQTMPHYDPTANFGMPREVVAEMVAAEGGIMAAVIRENRVPSTEQRGRGHKVTVSGTMPSTNGSGPGNGWVEPASVDNWQPPGLAVMEGLIDADDAKWRANRKREFGIK